MQESLDDLQFILSHHLRKPLCTMLGLLLLLERQEIDAVTREKLLQHLAEAGRDLNESTKEMLQVLSQTRKKLNPGTGDFIQED